MTSRERRTFFERLVGMREAYAHLEALDRTGVTPLMEAMAAAQQELEQQRDRPDRARGRRPAGDGRCPDHPRRRLTTAHVRDRQPAASSSVQVRTGIRGSKYANVPLPMALAAYIAASARMSRSFAAALPSEPGP